MEGLVLKVHGGFYEVAVDQERIICRMRGKNKRGEYAIIPGDSVIISLLNEREGVVEQVLPRKNALTRPLVANIDQLMIVAAHASPQPDFLLLDRLLVIAEIFGLGTFLCFNKEDVRNEYEKISGYYRNTGYEIFSVSAKPEKGLDILKKKLNGRVTAMAGNSGVGKSTLINALISNAAQATAPVSDKLLRGKHTTRTASFFPVDGGYLVDTPGFNVLHLPTIHEKGALWHYYPEYRNIGADCRFRNCMHFNEPGCAVKNAVENGILSKERYQHYLQLLRSDE